MYGKSLLIGGLPVDHGVRHHVTEVLDSRMVVKTGASHSAAAALPVSERYTQVPRLHPTLAAELAFARRVGRITRASWLQGEQAAPGSERDANQPCSCSGLHGKCRPRRLRLVDVPFGEGNEGENESLGLAVPIRPERSTFAPPRQLWTLCANSQTTSASSCLDVGYL